jgi:transposase InsO family protein
VPICARERPDRYGRSCRLTKHRSINAVAESFFATIKGEMIDHEDYLTRGAAIAAIADFIDGFYNPRRRHSALDYVSPIEFELKFMSENIDKMAA